MDGVEKRSFGGCVTNCLVSARLCGRGVFIPNRKRLEVRSAQVCGISSNAPRNLTFRQGNEFFLVSRHDVESPAAPLLLRLLDPFLRRRHEVPPYMARRSERGTPEDHEASAVLPCLDGNLVAGTEHQQPIGREAVTGNVDRAVEHVDRTLFPVGAHRNDCARVEPHVDIESVRKHPAPATSVLHSSR